MKIAMIRHFATPGNAKKQYIGRTDESLAAGAALSSAAARIRSRLAEVGMDTVTDVAASSMRRCVESADLLFPGVAPVTSRLLRECDFGLFEGKSYEELKDVPAYQRWLDSGGTIPFPGGEGQEQFRARCVRGFEEILRGWMKADVERAAMVVHGGTMMAVLARFDKERREFYHWQAANGAGYLITLDAGRWKRGEKVMEEIVGL